MHVYKAAYVEMGNNVFARQDQFFICLNPTVKFGRRYYPITEREAAEKIGMKYDAREMARLLADAQRAA